jgi:hypothetical protein
VEVLPWLRGQCPQVKWVIGKAHDSHSLLQDGLSYEGVGWGAPW